MASNPSGTSGARTFAVRLVGAATSIVVALVSVVTVGGLQCLRAQTTYTTVTPVRLRAAVVLPDMAIRPVALAQFDVVSVADSSRIQRVRTGLDGTVVLTVARERIRVRSVAPVRVGDSTYAWNVAFDLKDGGEEVELSNVNAQVSAFSATPRLARQLAPEREVFERVRSGVFRIEAGLGHGSGFLISDHGGLVVTNDHVVGTDPAPRVFIDSVTGYEAQIVARNREADLVVLRISESACVGCSRLALASGVAGLAATLIGERVLALGYPLSQQLTLTSGIVSSIRGRAIISDLNANPGNSGGPMMNFAGDVIGVITFGDFSFQRGPGVTGAIALEDLKALLQTVPERIAGLEPASSVEVPRMPTGEYSLSLVRSVADTTSLVAYRSVLGRSLGRFRVALNSPVINRVRQVAQAEAVGADRTAREAAAGVDLDERYYGAKSTREWERYVGALSSPVVTVAVEPVLAQTLWSLVLQAIETSQLGATASQLQLKFKGDVRNVRFYRNGIELKPIRGGHGPLEALANDRWVQLRDVADFGYYVISPFAFAPDSDGTPAVVTVAISDLINPDAIATFEIRGAMSARIWNDFIPFFQSTQVGSTVVLANPRLSKRITVRCAAPEGSCVATPIPPVWDRVP